MADFAEKAIRGAKSHTFAPSVGGPIDPITRVKLLDGTYINVTNRQLPVKSTFTNYNTFQWPAQGQYSSVLTNGGQVNVYITEYSGTGRCNGIPYLRMVITGDAATDSFFVPAPLWIQNLVCSTPSNSPYQNHDGTGLWYSLIETEDNDSWENEMELVGASITYENGFPIEHGRDTVFLIPLVGNVLGMDFFTPSVKGNMPFVFQFWNESVTKISGPSVTVPYIALEVQMEQLSAESLAALVAYRKVNDVTYIYPYEKIIRYTQAWTSDLLYTVNLNGITGDVAIFRFLLRASLVGRNLFTEVPIASFAIYNAAGNPITGTQVIDDALNRHKQQKNWTLGTASKHHAKYLFVWAAAKQGFLSMLLNGIKVRRWFSPFLHIPGGLGSIPNLYTLRAVRRVRLYQ